MFLTHVLIISLWYHHTYRCDDTRGCVMQFWPPDDDHMCSKHVEAWNKLNVKQKFCASSWLITEMNKHLFDCRLKNDDDVKGTVELAEDWPMLTGEFCAPHDNASLPACTVQKSACLSHWDFVCSKAKINGNLFCLKLDVASDIKMCLISRVVPPFSPSLRDAH